MGQDDIVNFLHGKVRYQFIKDIAKGTNASLRGTTRKLKTLNKYGIVKYKEERVGQFNYKKYKLKGE